MMGTRYKCLVTVFLILLASPEISHGCEMEGVIFWHFWQDVSIQDVFEGVVVNRSTSNILGIQSVTQTLTNRGPYMEVLMLDSFFIIRTNESFKYYEEYETSHQISVATTFNCVGGSTNSLTFIITVNDTNNNDPIFRPDDVYEFTMIPPLPPGFQITNNLNQILVRDIDLTTQRINFEILDNSYFIIDYDASSTTPKEFLASLKTTTFIRNIPETIEFIISATDVDLTGDPRRTSNATIRIQSDGSFELPEELVFSQTFYLADYTEENQIRLQEPITLQQGYHEQVTFSLVSGISILDEH
ncbi:unnamed protein product [Diatraea saccharalis]|uniref:Uncharacterized protein n=1 Tax=Diatraea saccharalis TaxID=40085 RepID=A0A9N9QX89_9NEOP|nr:unnamed protein product [Diatraea saccharalis]